jgi:hypothetical protein
MRFGDFLEFVQQYENGSLFVDHAYKNYDLLWKATDMRLRKALAEVGFTAGETSIALAECATRVRERGYAALSNMEVRRCLLEWFVWRRINAGEYRTWKYR